MNNRELVGLLQNLIEVSKDGEKGFVCAAEHAVDPALRDLFKQYAAACAAGARELECTIEQFGGEPKCRGSVAGALHRSWMSLKRTVVEERERAILEECERGEVHARSYFAHALTEKLPPDVRMLVQRLYSGTVHHHDRIRQLREEACRRHAA